MAEDLLRHWTLTQGQEALPIPPLVNYIIGFSTPSLVSWAISLPLQATLEAIFLTESQVRKAVVSRLAGDKMVMEGTGVVFGHVREQDQRIHFELILQGFEDINVFGLQPPKQCQMLTASGQKCGRLATLRHLRAAKQNGRDVPARVFATCVECNASTPSYAAPPGVTNPKDSNLFHWNLIRPEQAWEWSAGKNTNIVYLVN